MGRRHYLFLFLMICAGCARPAPAASLPTSATRERPTAAVPFDLYDGYLIVVHGSAGPLKNLNFLVDTGTTVPVLDSRIAQKLHLADEASESIVILGGRARGIDTELPSLAFGPVQRSNLQVVTTDLSFFRRILPVGIDAIVGLNVVGQAAFVIDYSGQVIRFGPPPLLAVSVPLKFDGGLATFDAEIDHAPVHLAFDTGVPSLVLFDPHAATTGGSIGAIKKVNDIGSFSSKPTRLRSVTLGEREFRRKTALLVSNPKQSQFDFDGLMSPPALGISQVSVDLKRGVLGFSR